ncbi:MAG: transposase [bacterium]
MATKPRYFETRFAYHVFNCGTAKRSIFRKTHDYQKFLSVVSFYTHQQAIKLSRFNTLDVSDQKKYLNDNPRNSETKRISLLAFCLMPNHFHFLIRPCTGGNLSTALSDIANSYTKYFNKRYKRMGRLFQGPFKSKKLEGDGNVLNVSRYIHLNPVLSSKTNPEQSTDRLFSYPYSSYINWTKDFSHSDIVDATRLKNWVKLAGGQEKYKQFVKDGLNKNYKNGVSKTLYLEESVN